MGISLDNRRDFSEAGFQSQAAVNIFCHSTRAAYDGVSSSPRDGFDGTGKRPFSALIRQVYGDYYGNAEGDSQNGKADLPGVPDQIPEAR